MLASYYTTKGPGEHEIMVQKSKFIAAVNRAETEESAQTFIREIKKKHYNATHNCSAYMIGPHNEIQKANDDGEPSGTAGVPMLEVLKKRDIKDTVVVVTRYFGGIKLGAGGLIRAYGNAVTEGLDATGIVRRDLMKIMHLTFDYASLGKVENELRNSPYAIKDIQYLERVDMAIYVPEADTERFTEWIENLTNGNVDIRLGDFAYLEKPV